MEFLLQTPQMPGTRKRNRDEKGKKSVSFSANTDSQKKCVPGPKAEFPPGALPMYEYYKNIGNNGKLGCEPNQTVEYQEDGKYCCVNVHGEVDIGSINKKNWILRIIS